METKFFYGFSKHFSQLDPKCYHSYNYKASYRLTNHLMPQTCNKQKRVCSTFAIALYYTPWDRISEPPRKHVLTHARTDAKQAPLAIFLF